MWLIYDTTKNEVVRKLQAPFNSDETVQPPPPFVQLKVLNDEAKPAFDQATEKLVLTHRDDFAAFTRTYYFEKAALSAAEKTLYQEAQEKETQRQQLKAVYTKLKAGTATNAEMQKAIAYLLRDSVSNGTSGAGGGAGAAQGNPGSIK